MALTQRSIALPPPRARPPYQSGSSASRYLCVTLYPRPSSWQKRKPPVVGRFTVVTRAGGTYLLRKTAPASELTCVCKVGQSGLELEKPKKDPERRVNGVFWLILLNLGIYVVDHVFKLPIKDLYLHHARPDWFQFVTATFCHSNWEHLSGNLFFLYIFGKLVEEEEGNLGLWISYIITGAGANLVSWLVLPRSAVSVGASGAVFGLFAVSVLVKMSWDWRKILEVLILGQFVVEKVLEAAQASTSLVGSMGRGSSVAYVNHIAHLSGALIGAALIYLISRVPSQSSGKDTTPKQGK